MKYLKTYESKIINYPNLTDNQYWYYINIVDDGETKTKNIFLLKFVKYDKEYNGANYFDVITLKDYKDGRKLYNKGDKIEDEFIFTENGIRKFQKNNTLRLATSEEIELYDIYEQQNKYNL